MLTILWGLAGSGKSHMLLSGLTEKAKRGGRHYLLTPEPFSHEQERALCRRVGPRLSQNTEVLTFGRMATRVLSEIGGLGTPLLDEGGRLLMLKRALDTVGHQTRVWRELVKRADFWPMLLRTIDECKMYRISAEVLALTERAASGRAEDTLHDLRLVLTAYESIVGQSFYDPRDLLSRAADSLSRSSYGGGEITWTVDGFARFTVQEKDILARLIASCSEMTVALTGLPDGPDDGVFAVSRHTAEELARLAERAAVPVAQQVLSGAPRYQNPALTHLSRYFLRQGGAIYKGEASGVEIVRLSDMRAECAYVAARVRALTRDEGYRYRDIAVTARNFDAYAAEFEREAARLDLPLFWDRKEDLRQKPLYVFLSAALDTVSRGCPHDALFRMLKTGLYGIPWEACDRLENYALTHHLKGSAWLGQEDWTLPPSGFGRQAAPGDEEELRNLNNWRRQVMGPLKNLRKRASREKTIRGHARVVYDFLEEIHLPERLNCRFRELGTIGEPQRADQTRQMWDILCHALDQCVDLLGDTPATLAEFSETFSLLITRYDVGSIPVALDRLSCGDADRVRRRSLRCVILMGATFAALPQPAPSAGLLGREERTLLRECGAELAPNEDERMVQELDIIYGAFTLPSERLIVTWPARGAEFEDNQPSFAVTELQERLRLPTGVAGEWDGAHMQATGPCAEWLSERPDGTLAHAARAAAKDFPEIKRALDILETVYPTTCGQLPKEAVTSLYGETLTLSPSRIETFMQCPYAYYLQFGLRAKPRMDAAFSAPDAGRFIHFVLEKTLREIKNKGGYEAAPDERVRDLGRSAARDYVRENMGGQTGRTARARWLFARLERAVDAVLQNVVDEIRRSDFTPLDMELRFAGGADDALPAVPAGRFSQVTGVADRVDGWIYDDHLYIRVVDYKTGKPVFRLSDIYYGLGLQLFLYLFALEREGLGRYASLGVRGIIPAGALYLPARETYLTMEPESSEKELRRAMADALRRVGLILEDPAVIEAMERGVEGEAEFLPVRFKRGGEELSALSSVASLERFGLLRQHVDRLLIEMETALLSGDMSARPVCKGAQSACDFCDFRPACQFDERLGDRPRRLSALRDKEVWLRLEEEAWS